MRVSERSLFDTSSKRLEQLKTRFAEKAAQASSGLRVPTASSDPAAAALLSRNSASHARADSMQRNARSAGNDLAAVDGALSEAAGVLEQALSLAIQMSNDSFSPADRAAAATSADSQLKSFVSALNVEQDGRFLLSGTAQDRAPFATDGSYLGDDGSHSLEIAPGVFEEVTVRADQGIKGTGVTGGVDIPAVLTSLRDALATNDTAAIRASIDGLRSSVTQLSGLRSDVGAKGNLLFTAESTAQSVKLSSEQSSADAGDIDIAETATELSLAQRAFEAATQATSKTFGLTLLNTLR